MAQRHAETIVAEWRTLQRALDGCADAQERIDLERAIATLADKYREAVGSSSERAAVAPTMDPPWTSPDREPSPRSPFTVEPSEPG